MVRALTPVSTIYLTPNATGALTLNSNLVVNITGDQLGSSTTSGINGWDIVIRDNDPSGINLNPTSISISDNLLSPFGTIFEQVNCVNGGVGFVRGMPGNTGCDVRDGAGVVHTAGVVLGYVSPTPISGLIAKIFYRVNGAGEDLLNVPNPCPGSQGCDTLSDGSITPVPHITLGADIQSSAIDFKVSTTNPPPILPGGSLSGTVTITSLHGYSAAMTLRTDSFPANGLTVSCSAVSPSPLPAFGTSSSICSFNGTTPGLYFVNVNATAGTLFHLASFSVKIADFSIAGASRAVKL